VSVDLDAVRSHWERNHPEFATLLDLRLEELAPGIAVMRLPFRTEVANGNGAVHGGAITSLADTAFYVAHATVFGWEQATVTTSITCNFLAAARQGADLVARANVIKSGKRLVYGEVSVHAGETLVAHATLSYLNTERTGS
jgi:acyl-CoA thioesterase